MLAMIRVLFLRTLVLSALALPAGAAGSEVPWPSNAQLRAIQQAAYACALNNDTISCDRARSLADPLMDHPRLSGLCKDVVWSLIEQAQVADTNDFRRRDAIDQPARRLSIVCAQPVKPTAKPANRTQS